MPYRHFSRTIAPGYRSPRQQATRVIRIAALNSFFPEPFIPAVSGYYMALAMIGGPYQGTALHVLEAQLITDLSQLGKLIRMNKTFDRQMFFSGLEILPHRDHVHAAAAEIFQGLHHFFLALAQAQHNAALGAHISLFQDLQGFHTAPVLGLYTHLAGEPFDRFYTMRDHIRSNLHDTGYILLLCFEIGDQGLQRRIGIERVYGPDMILPDNTAAILQLVPVYGSGPRPLHLHHLDSFVNPLRFIPIHRIRATGSYGAKSTTARTDIAQDHKGSGALPPAFAHIGAIAALTDRM